MLNVDPAHSECPRGTLPPKLGERPEWGKTQFWALRTRPTPFLLFRWILHSVLMRLSSDRKRLRERILFYVTGKVSIEEQRVLSRGAVWSVEMLRSWVVPASMQESLCPLGVTASLARCNNDRQS